MPRLQGSTTAPVAWNAGGLQYPPIYLPTGACLQMLPADAASVVRNRVPFPFKVCGGIYGGMRQGRGVEERARIRGWWPRKKCG